MNGRCLILIECPPMIFIVALQETFSTSIVIKIPENMNENR